MLPIPQSQQVKFTIFGQFGPQNERQHELANSKQVHFKNKVKKLITCQEHY